MQRRGFLKRCAGLLVLAAAVPVVKADPKAELYRKMVEQGRLSTQKLREMERDAQHLQTKRGRLESRTRMVPSTICNSRGEPYDPPVMVEQRYVAMVFDDGSEFPVMEEVL